MEEERRKGYKVSSQHNGFVRNANEIVINLINGCIIYLKYFVFETSVVQFFGLDHPWGFENFEYYTLKRARENFLNKKKKLSESVCYLYM